MRFPRRRAGSRKEPVSQAGSGATNSLSATRSLSRVVEPSSRKQACRLSSTAFSGVSFSSTVNQNLWRLRCCRAFSPRSCSCRVIWSPAAAEVVRIEVTSRADVAGGKAFGATGRTEARGTNLLRGRTVPRAKQDHHRHRQGSEERPRTHGVFVGLLPDQAEADRARERHRAVRGLEPRRQRDARLLQPGNGQSRSDNRSPDGRRLPDDAGLHAALGRLAVRCAEPRGSGPGLCAHRHRERQADRRHCPQRSDRRGASRQTRRSRTAITWLTPLPTRTTLPIP